jgi:chaperonin GroEL
MSKQIKFDDEARASIKAGIDILAKAVKMTLGPRGKAAIIEKSYGAPMVTFDGVTVAKEIELKDKYEKLGADLIKQAAEKTNDTVGDGTTTATVLAHAMINACEEILNKTGVNVIQLAEKLKVESKKVIALLEQQKEDVSTKKKIQEVATLSSKDKEIGSLIAEVMDKIGKEGVVTVEDSNTIGNSYEVVDGMRFDRGYISPYMTTSPEKMNAEVTNVPLLVTDKNISSITDILPILEKSLQAGKKELAIIADDFSNEVATMLVVNKLKGIFNAIAIKAPGYGDRKKETLQDIAVLTGAKFISEDSGSKLEDAIVSDFGNADKLIVTKDSTVIVGGKGVKVDIHARIETLKILMKSADGNFEKEKLKERVAKLSGGIAVIKIGSPIESAQKELKQRVEDAVAATRAAMEEGVVPGGGKALYNVLRDYDTNSDAGEIIAQALIAPIIAIVENSGKNFRTFDSTELELFWRGYDASKEAFVDLKEAGIIDPLKVVKLAFLNAISVASNYLMTGAAIIVEESEEKEK